VVDNCVGQIDGFVRSSKSFLGRGTPSTAAVSPTRLPVTAGSFLTGLSSLMPAPEPTESQTPLRATFRVNIANHAEPLVIRTVGEAARFIRAFRDEWSGSELLRDDALAALASASC